MPNATPPTPHPGAGDDTRAVMSRAIRELDSESLRRAVLESHARIGTDAVVADVLVPALREVGDLWRAGDLSVLHEHHASQIVRSVVEEFRREAIGLRALAAAGARHGHLGRRIGADDRSRRGRTARPSRPSPGGTGLTPSPWPGDGTTPGPSRSGAGPAHRRRAPGR